MKIIEPFFEVLNMTDPEYILRFIEKAGRTCYKSEEKSTEDSAKEFVRRLIKSGHHSVIEHITISVKVICDRGVSHEIVRHRLASYSQESTRYANYSKDQFGREITFIKPPFWKENSEHYLIWQDCMSKCERAYMKLIDEGASPQQARSVLPNSLKTEIVMTCNIREWRHIFNLRCSAAAHPQMREIMLPLLEMLNNTIPVLFEDIFETYFGKST